MIEFILNNKTIKTDEPAGSTLLDFVRYQQQLTGTKIGCREGDCGACTLLLGQLVDDQMHYKSLTSCITPLGNADGKHVVSIEGLNMDRLSPFQQAMVDTSGSQCGMCTVGFIVSFAGECLSPIPTNKVRMISAIDGNICRCTGYKSIERAADIVVEKLDKKPDKNQISWLINEGFIPSYFHSIPERLRDINTQTSDTGDLLLGGGTDLLVQRPDAIHGTDIQLTSKKKAFAGIELINDQIFIKGGTNTTEMLDSPILNSIFPNLWKHIKLVSSTPIRNIATIAGNLVNASPIGDLTAFFMALNATLHIVGSKENHTIRLKDFYTGYKQIKLNTDEFVSAISFMAPDEHTHFNFEKVSKRRYLDIATVNTAISIQVVDEEIQAIHLSAGGVGPTPKYLENTCDYLIGKKLSPSSILPALEIAQDEIAPISDVRGSETYKRLLLRQLIFAHFIELFPQHFQLTHLV